MYLLDWSEFENVQRYSGVFATSSIPASLTFGPYQGPLNILLKTKDHKRVEYVLEVSYKCGHLIWVVDRHLSWVPFMNFARCPEEQNLEVFLCDGSFYFHTICKVEPGEELLIWPSERLSTNLMIQERVTPRSKHIENETKGEKRKRTESGASKSDKKTDINGTNKGKKKTKRKKPKIESITTTLDGSQVTDVLWSTFCDCTADTLSTIELEDLVIDETCCLTDDTIHTGASEDISKYLIKVVPDWSQSVARLKKKSHRGSPILLLVSCAATRIVELNRSAVEFKGYCKTVKLFAKHIKVSEQELTLESQVVHFGIGTPSRILKLLQNGSLKTSRLKYVILDWTWRDQKLRRMIDIPEVRGELINLLKEYIFPLAKASKLKIGLF